MSTHNIGFYEEISKIIFSLSSNTHLISSAAVMLSSCCSRRDMQPLSNIGRITITRSSIIFMSYRIVLLISLKSLASFFL